MKTAMLAAMAMILFFGCGAVPLRAQNTSSGDNGPKFPATPQGELGQAFVEAVNGDRAARLDFFRSRVPESVLTGERLSGWLSLLEKMAAQSGGVDAGQVSIDSQAVSILLRSRKANGWARVFLMSAREQPGKLANIFVFTAIDPQVEAKLRFPKTRMSERAAVREIERQAALRSSLDTFSGVVLVAEGDRIVFNRAYGMANKSFAVPNNPNTKFHLGSMDKMFAAVAVAQLVEAGRLSFDDTLARVLPDYPDREAAAKITIHQLLTHTAGLGDFIMHPEFRAQRERFVETADYIPIIAREPLRSEPGTRMSYSNSGYVLLGAVIEKLSGQSYFDYVRKHIFEPAGMSETGYYTLSEVVPNLAVGYLRSAPEDPFGILPRRSNVMFIPFKGNSAGGGYSTALDLFRFSRALRGHKLLGSAMTELVTGPKLDFAGAPEPQKWGYGFTTKAIENGRELRGMSGGGASSGVNSSLEMFWNGSYTVVVVGNYDAPAAQDLNLRICRFLALQDAPADTR